MPKDLTEEFPSTPENALLSIVRRLENKGYKFQYSGERRGLPKYYFCDLGYNGALGWYLFLQEEGVAEIKCIHASQPDIPLDYYMKDTLNPTQEELELFNMEFPMFAKVMQDIYRN